MSKTPEQIKHGQATFAACEAYFDQQLGWRGWLNKAYYWLTQQDPPERMYFICDVCGAYNPLLGNAVSSYLDTGPRHSYGIGCVCGQRYILNIARL